MLHAAVKYGKRVVRMTSLLATGRIQWISYKMGLRPGQISALAVGGGIYFCEDETEQMFFQG